jgi:hypothetical protein
MENILLNPLPEVVLSSSDPVISRRIGELVRKGQLRKIAPRIYTPNLTDPAETIIRRNLFTILGILYPGAVLSHRSALEFQPTKTGHLFLTYSYTKKIELPGLTLNFIEGPGHIEGDNKLSGDLHASQLERALLENLQTSRKQGPESKTLPISEVENRLEMILRTQGEKELNKVRDKAKRISVDLEMNKEFEKLNKVIGAMLTTKPSKILTSPLAMARALGNPYDPVRIQLFEKLFVELQQHEFEPLPEQNSSDIEFKNFAFYEAYFSNFIEGTEFEIEDAKQIVLSGNPMPSRDEDSHDVLGTYQLVSAQAQMSIIPSNPDQLLDLMRARHKVILKYRPSKQPGKFKDRNNRAGDTHFVDYSLVRGTLIKGFDYYNALNNPFARASYIMFLVSEVHPFLDGNGRIARVMMNAELVHRGQSKIIIPTVYRDAYLGGLRSLTRRDDAAAYIRMLHRAHQFSSRIHGDDMEAMQKQLEAMNAFKEPSEAKLKFML